MGSARVGSNPTGVAILHPSKVSWPSGLRRSTQVRVSSEAWVRIPPEPYFFPFEKKKCRVTRKPRGSIPRLEAFLHGKKAYLKHQKKGAKGDSNPRPLAPKARIIPLDHWPLQVKLEGFEPPTFGSGIRRATVAP